MNQISNFSIEPVLIFVLNSYLFAQSNFVNRKSVYAASTLEKEPAKSRGWRGFVGDVDSVGAWVAWLRF